MNINRISASVTTIKKGAGDYCPRHLNHVRWTRLYTQTSEHLSILESYSNCQLENLLPQMLMISLD